VPDVSDPPPRKRDLRARDLSMSFAAQDFPVLAAKTMQIEQNRDSMGVRYDGGDYRDISWGHRQRGLWEVHSGWKDGDLYIISKAHDATATQIIQLSDSGRELAVQIEIKSGDTMTFYRVFERGSGTFQPR
jgi:hypothetical protein